MLPEIHLSKCEGALIELGNAAIQVLREALKMPGGGYVAVPEAHMQELSECLKRLNPTITMCHRNGEMSEWLFAPISLPATGNIGLAERFQALEIEKNAENASFCEHL